MNYLAKNVAAGLRVFVASFGALVLAIGGAVGVSATESAPSSSSSGGSSSGASSASSSTPSSSSSSSSTDSPSSGSSGTGSSSSSSTPSSSSSASVPSGGSSGSSSSSSSSGSSAPTSSSTPAPYVPPAEASKGTGGWAAVDPKTGAVSAVIVCSIDVCGPGGAFGGKLPGTDHVLRYQTNATSDGNVAGWNGSNVKWNESAGTFTISGSSTDTAGNKTTTTQTLVPEKTASDGKNLSTGIVSSVTTHETAPKNDQTARVVVEQKGLDDANAKTTVTFPEWSGGKSFEYQSPGRARANLQSDVKAGLRGEGFVVPDSASGGAGGGAGAGDSGAGESGAGGDSGGAVVAAGDAAVADASASGSPGDEPVADGSGDGGSGAGGGAEGDVAAGEGEVDGGGEPADDPSTSEPDVPVFVQTILDLTDQVKTFLDDFFGWFGLGGDDAAVEPADEVAAGDDAAVEPADEVADIE